MNLKIAIVGPGRSKQGTGPYIAKIFSQFGAHIVGVVSSSMESAEQSVDALKNEFGIQTKAFNHIEELFSEFKTDIVAISSPFNTHLEYLKACIKNSCHVFCEKPLWWPSQNYIDVNNVTKDTISLVNSFKHKKLYLQLNTQWPFTLPTYYQLHPQTHGSINEFTMWLWPQSKDKNRILDAVPHLLSMLYVLVGAGQIQNIFSNNESNNLVTSLKIEFDYLHARGDTKVCIHLDSTDSFPKPAAYAINGKRVDRCVELPRYLISLQTSEKQLPLVDPLASSIKNFIGSIHSKTALDEVALIDGMTHLAQIYRAVTTK